MESLTTDYLRMLLFPFLLSIPIFIVIIGGIALSIFRYKTSPKTSLFSIVGLLIIAIVRVIYILQPILNVWLIQSKIEPDTFNYLFGTISVITALLSAIALAILIFAIWSQREKKVE